MTDVHFVQPATHFNQPVAVVERDFHSGHHNSGSLDATEMAAFEKGRMQGEMEAIRRMEADQSAMQLKQFPVDQLPVATVQTPDVIEINRLTYLQKIAAWTSQATGLAVIVLTVIWASEYRTGFGWTNNSSDAIGNVSTWNTGFICGVVGLCCLGQAIMNYRMLPLNLNPRINQAIYMMWQSFATVGFMIFLAALIRTPTDSTFWGVETWCYAGGLAVWGTHMLYSVFRLLRPGRPVDYETWSETNNKLSMHETPEQRRDRSAYNHAGATVYTPAPKFPHRAENTIPSVNQNVGAEVPVAPGNAPRWAENPNTHADNYFLLPRAKWAVCGFFAMGASMLMIFAALQHSLASGRLLWPQGPADTDSFSERSPQSDIMGAIGVLSLFSIILVAYAAMPPRTTLVKNGILQGRRSSISHNAETRIGNIV